MNDYGLQNSKGFAPVPEEIKQAALPIRFALKVEIQTNDCWNWLGYVQPESWGGYGLFRVGSTKIGAHRWAYEQVNGPVPEGLEIDHLCRNRRCVNPDHLEAVTHQINVLRGKGITAFHARQTRCKRGHLFNSLNTYYSKTGRSCRACRNHHEREQRRRDKEQRNPSFPKTYKPQGIEESRDSEAPSTERGSDS